METELFCIYAPCTSCVCSSSQPSACHRILLLRREIQTHAGPLDAWSLPWSRAGFKIQSACWVLCTQVWEISVEGGCAASLDKHIPVWRSPLLRFFKLLFYVVRISLAAAGDCCLFLLSLCSIKSLVTFSLWAPTMSLTSLLKSKQTQLHLSLVMYPVFSIF